MPTQRKMAAQFGCPITNEPMQRRLMRRNRDTVFDQFLNFAEAFAGVERCMRSLSEVFGLLTRWHAYPLARSGKSLWMMDPKSGALSLPDAAADIEAMHRLAVVTNMPVVTAQRSPGRSHAFSDLSRVDAELTGLDEVGSVSGGFISVDEFSREFRKLSDGD
jgi:hypothetical protein